MFLLFSKYTNDIILQINELHFLRTTHIIFIHQQKKYVRRTDIVLHNNDKMISYTPGYTHYEDNLLNFEYKDTLIQINVYFTDQGYDKMLQILKHTDAA